MNHNHNKIMKNLEIKAIFLAVVLLFSEVSLAKADSETFNFNTEVTRYHILINVDSWIYWSTRSTLKNRFSSEKWSPMLRTHWIRLDSCRWLTSQCWAIWRICRLKLKSTNPKIISPLGILASGWPSKNLFKTLELLPSRELLVSLRLWQEVILTWLVSSVSDFTRPSWLVIKLKSPRRAIRMINTNGRPKQLHHIQLKKIMDNL